MALIEIIVLVIVCILCYWFFKHDNKTDEKKHKLVYDHWSPSPEISTPPYKSCQSSIMSSPSVSPLTKKRIQRQLPNAEMCKICQHPMDDPIKLNCGHSFDRKCYTLREKLIMQFQPKAKLCLSC
ncbi:uncharacterized protein LOC124184752 [Neodiprion fabricii]|uniref:uncharacterized protein LOC124184752 n=1 Tax=Neodiprion fabricii TaxID=2872261 RepID=UPI001ED90468|nr:uncharacterized protein LOC124184752 [Neodiprion fabricii]